jgi:hypothetical protein
MGYRAMNRTRLSYSYDSNDVAIFISTCGCINKEVSRLVGLRPELYGGRK